MINKILSKYRYLKVKQDLIDNIIQFGIFLISFISIFMLTEFVFYLSSLDRFRIFLSFVSFILIFTSYVLIKIFLNLKVINPNLSDERLAEEIGNKIPKLSDKIIKVLLTLK